MDLQARLQQFEQWSTTATRDHDGWESSFPGWSQLIQAALHAMLNLEQGASIDPRLIAQVWSVSEETEDLVAEILAAPHSFGTGLRKIYEVGDWKARWQIVSLADRVPALGLSLLSLGVQDQDAYVRRRALLALANLNQAHAAAAAQSMLDDTDSTLRQIAASIAEGRTE